MNNTQSTHPSPRLRFGLRFCRHCCGFFLLLAATAAGADDAGPRYPPAAEVKAAFLKLLDRPKVAAEPKTLSEPKTAGGLITEHFSIATDKHADGAVERTPMIVVRPELAKGKLPVVIVLHGTGGSKDGERGLCGELAKRGIIGVAIDARYHGERVPGGAHGASEYVDAITLAWRTKDGQPMEHPFYYDTCWDLWRVIDYLQARDDVDPERIGMIGFSMGGIETWLAASVDERVKVAVPCIGVQSLRWSLENEQWQGRAGTIRGAHEAAAQDLGEPKVNGKVCRALWSKVIPGILDQFDCPSMLRLFAGRPLLIISGEKDPNNPLPGAKLAIASAEAAYREAGCPEKLSVDIAPGVAHSVTQEQHAKAVEWLERRLKDDGAAKKSTDKHQLRIVPKKTDAWGAEIEDVQAVLDSAGRQLWKHFPERELPLISVEPKGGPITLFKRGPQGEIQVRLDTGDRYWTQHAFQFGHELCHILCNYQDDPHPNLWFEESLCELASLYTLRQMAIEWQTSPPYPNWKGYAEKLKDYADERIAKAQLPSGQSLADWHARHVNEMRAKAELRELNTVVAVALLPLFEKSPEHWEAVTWLNGGQKHGNQTLAQYLDEWRRRAPERHRDFIRDVARQFKIELPAEVIAH